jgi:hypothetical protein
MVGTRFKGILPNRLTKRKERKREESKNFATREEVIL